MLLDSHAILHRAYHALPDFSSSKGEPTGALYGLSAILIKIINEFKPDYLIACYDLPEKTFRHEAYENYKAGRKKAEDDLISQLERSRHVVRAFGIPIYDKPKFEADDILGTIVELTSSLEDLEIIIASGDMDTLQLVQGKKVRVFTLKKGINDTIIYDEKAVIDRFGFKPKLLPDYKGLRGDPSDNIIGVRGIGEKTASLLIQKFGAIEQIYQKLKKGDKAFLDAGFKQRIIDLLRENEEEARFSKTLAEIRKDAPINFKLPEKRWAESVQANEVVNLFKELEFRTLSQRLKDLLLKNGKADSQKSSLEEKREINQEELKKTALALWVVDSNITNPDIEDILNFAKTDDFEKAKKIIFGELDKRTLKTVYQEIELPLLSAVDEMKNRGVKIDKQYLKELSKSYHQKLSKLEEKIYKSADQEFNINSPKQLGVILFDKLKLKTAYIKKTEGGARSTRESELLKLKDEHRIINLILEYRELQKLLSTYVDVIPEYLDKASRLHGDFILSGTTTGRMSSQNPNLQNIPKGVSHEGSVRKAFIAEDGFKLVSFDYSQVELRIAAILSNDQNLIDIFKKGEDVHSAVASKVFDIALDEVDQEMRRKAKIINFGIIYGMGINALRQNLGGTRKEAQKFYDSYFTKFSKLADYLEEIKKSASEKGYTETLFGRKRHFEGIKSKIPYIRASAERMAINAPIQGTQSDIIKIAMRKVNDYIEKDNLKKNVFLLLQVHDELVYEIKDDLVSSVVNDIKKIMENILDQSQAKDVPIIVNAKAGDNWGELNYVD